MEGTGQAKVQRGPRPGLEEQGSGTGHSGRKQPG